MEINIVKATKNLPRKLKVAAYARVSTGSEEMLNSLSTQVSHYQSVINDNPKYLFAGVFVDEAKTGTKANRPGFQEMLTKARNGEIDLILVKSVSRFARNAVDLLSIARELAAINVDIYFEEQDIHSISFEGELMLTLWASFAQEESRSMSENIKWKIRKDMQEGLPQYCRALGYEIKGREFRLIPEEAEIVRKIFDLFLEGKGTLLIARYLNENGYRNINGSLFIPERVVAILKNYTYTADLLLQKTYRENHITKRKRKNNGVLPQYLIRNHHEGIISLETFEKAQALLKEKKAKYKHSQNTRNAFSGMVVCAECGSKLCRRTVNKKHYFLCRNRINKNLVECHNRQIPEEELYRMSTEVLGLKNFDETIFNERVSKILAYPDCSVVYYFKDGTTAKATWAFKSRKESWTKEMRDRARTYARKGREHGN